MLKGVDYTRFLRDERKHHYSVCIALLVGLYDDPNPPARTTSLFVEVAGTLKNLSRSPSTGLRKVIMSEYS
jgi:hypothetical protein